MKYLRSEIESALEQAEVNSEVKIQLTKYLAAGSVLRTDDPLVHFCVYFWPYNPETKEVFLIYHKKANLWLSPGGHIEPGESLVQAVIREAAEELNLKLEPSQVPQPSLFTITPINTSVQICKEHLDVWHFIPTLEIIIWDKTEFYQAGWFSLDQAKSKITETNTILALDQLSQRLR